MKQDLLQLVFSPLRINGLDVPNRVLMSSMHLNHEGEDQYERMAHFYALRSHEGPGLMVTAGCSPDGPGCARPGGFSLDSDALIERHRVLTRAVHTAGHSRLALQLLHFGRESFHGRLVAPSALRLPGSPFTPAALDEEGIRQIILNYAAAARRAVEAGYDAIEIVFSQGFLIHQFLSPHSNLREDDWGGDATRRMRFALEVASAVRNAVGPGFPLIFRVPCLDLLQQGLRFQDALTLIGALRPYGMDLLNVSIGWHESTVPTLATIVPQAGFASVAARIKQLFPDLSVCVSNRINDLRHAEELLLDRHADMVAMGRPFLADRAILHKSRLGRFEAINACIACNQNCLDHVFLGEEVGCSVDPQAGRRDEGLPLPVWSSRPSIAVIGGGLAGMCTAVFLARRGARVTLFERSRRLGGQMLMAARIPGKAEFLETVRYYEQQLHDLAVDIRLGQAADLAGQHWAHVVVATGTEPNALPEGLLPVEHLSSCESVSAGTGKAAEVGQHSSNPVALEDPAPVRDGKAAGLRPSLPRIYSYDEVLMHFVPLAFPVVIVGGGGVACDVAKFVLQRRTRVQLADDYLQKFGAESMVGPLGPLPHTAPQLTIVQRSSRKIAHRIGRTTRWITLAELERHNVEFIRGGRVRQYSSEGVDIELLDGSVRALPARTVIIASGQRSTHGPLVYALAKAGQAFSVVGAACARPARPASISSSIHAAWELARDLQLDSLGQLSAARQVVVEPLLP